MIASRKAIRHIFIFGSIMTLILLFALWKSNVSYPSDVKTKIQSAKRIVVTCYLPNVESDIFLFILLLYGSWKFVTDNAQSFYTEQNKENFRRIDLLVFCHPGACLHLPKDCRNYSPHDVKASKSMGCWIVEQTFESPINYGPINSYIMFNRTDTYDLFHPYERILRTDYDVFLTPALLTWPLRKKMIFGHGEYCESFNMNRLKEISRRLGMRHQGVHCIGSTWYGETDIAIETLKMAYDMTSYIFLNEFHPKLPGLETIRFDIDPAGEWKRWYKPVSSMYGGEMAANDLIDGLSEGGFMGTFDSSSCSTDDYLTTPHIHCWHAKCDFQKFTFLNDLQRLIESRDKLDGATVHNIVKNTYERDWKHLPINEYANYIAWNGVGKFLKKWFF